MFLGNTGTAVVIQHVLSTSTAHTIHKESIVPTRQELMCYTAAAAAERGAGP